MYDTKRRNEKKEIITQDGSKTLYSCEFNEPYHSTKDGALHESLSKHVIPALKLQADKEQVTILDICFGLGYNTLATLHYIKEHDLTTQVEILAPEFDEALIRSLAEFTYPQAFDHLKPVIETLSRNLYYEDEQFKIQILLGDARESIPQIQKGIDIVYQDAFSPKQNPLLWTREYFADIRKILAEDGIITTYSTAAATRMGLYENGLNLFYYEAENTRRSLIASPSDIEGWNAIDMVLKIERNPTARSLRDSDFIG